MRIFITGATGFVGRNLALYLTREFPEYEYVYLVRDPDKAREIEEQLQRRHERITPIRMLEGDLHRPATYHRYLKEADIIIHAAALVGLRNGPAFYSQNTDTMQRLLLSAQSANRLKRIVFISSIAAVDRPAGQIAALPLNETSPINPHTDYGKAKRQAEELLIRSQLPYTIIRPAYIYGPYPRPNSSVDRLLTDVQNKVPYTRIHYPGRCSAIHVEDLAQLIWKCAIHPNTENQQFFAAHRDPVHTGQVFRQVAEALDIPFEYRETTPETIERLKDFIDTKTRLSGNTSLQILNKVLFENYFLCNSQKLCHALNWEPQINLEEGIARTLYWYRQQGWL